MNEIKLDFFLCCNYYKFPEYNGHIKSMSQTVYKTIALGFLVLLMVIHIWLEKDRYGWIFEKLQPSLQQNLQTLENHTTLLNYTKKLADSNYLTTPFPSTASPFAKASPFAVSLGKLLGESKFEHKTTLLSRGGCGKSRLKLLVLL